MILTTYRCSNDTNKQKSIKQKKNQTNRYGRVISLYACNGEVMSFLWF